MYIREYMNAPVITVSSDTPLSMMPRRSCMIMTSAACRWWTRESWWDWSPVTDLYKHLAQILGFGKPAVRLHIRQCPEYWRKRWAIDAPPGFPIRSGMTV